jgi:hypothetical protein
MQNFIQQQVAAAPVHKFGEKIGPGAGNSLQVGVNECVEHNEGNGSLRFGQFTYQDTPQMALEYVLGPAQALVIGF